MVPLQSIGESSILSEKSLPGSREREIKVKIEEDSLRMKMTLNMMRQVHLMLIWRLKNLRMESSNYMIK